MSIIMDNNHDKYVMERERVFFFPKWEWDTLKSCLSITNSPKGENQIKS